MPALAHVAGRSMAQLAKKPMNGSYWGNENFRRGLTLGGVLIAIALVAHGIFGSDGLVTYLQKRRQYAALRMQIQRRKQENQQLQKEVQGLKSDPATIERYAREDLHMARKHEMIYVLPQKASGSADADVNKRPSSPPAAPE
jgi:cell division protein FtsB